MKKTLIERIEVGSGGAAAIEFTSIPADYTDLLVKLSVRSSRVANDDGGLIKFNGSTATFTNRRLYAVPSVGSNSSSVGFFGLVGGTSITANTFGSSSIYIPNYRSSANKSFSTDSVVENNSSTFFADLVAGLWSTTDAITSITIYAQNSNLVQYSSASLYGVSSGSDGTTTVS